MEDGFCLAKLHTLVRAGKIRWSAHMAIRMRERGIAREDVFSCLYDGDIIEMYEDDEPHQSALMCGKTSVGTPLHVVCALDGDTLCHLITAYIPSPEKWEADYKTRKAATS